MKRRTLAMSLAFVALLSLMRPAGGERGMIGRRTPAIPAPRIARVDADLGKLPLSFIPNHGQLAGPAAFYVRGRDKTIYFAAAGLTFVLSGLPGSAAARWVVKLDFVGADPRATPVSLEGSGTVFSFFKGRPENWRAGIPGSSKIVYRELWPGIDLAYYGTMDRMKYEFIVHPGADPARIKLAYRGARSVALTEQGRLAITTPAGSIEDDVPVAWQEVEGTRTDVTADYALEAADGAPGYGDRTYGFRIGPYDRSRTLVLDPAVLVYCGYIGGSVWDEGKAIAVDTGGNAYVAGSTGSSESDFPVMVGPDLTYNGDPLDAFVAKVNAAGTGLLYCSYLGGNDWDEAGGIAVDLSGNAYVVGYTTSSDFPVTAGSALIRGGDRDAFVAKIDADGSALVYSGCIGGGHEESAKAVAVDDAGHAYVTGETFSDDLPVVVGPNLTYNGMQDVFAAKVNAAGTALDYCGYIGSWSNQEGRGIAVDSAGSAYITGNTGPDFPVKAGPGQTWAGGNDAFVAKVESDGTGLVYSGYIGGEFEEVGHAIAVDSAGNTYVTGFSDSPESTFPATVGPDLTRNEGAADAFVAKVSADGTTLVYCGFIGGGPNAHDPYRPGNDYGNGIAVDGAGNAYVVGQTDSSEETFPVTSGPGLTWNGLNDIFVAKVNADGTGLVYCGYIGGAEEDEGRGIAVDSEGNAYITGWACSAEDTFPVLTGPDPTYNLAWDAFVAKVSSYDVPAPPLTSLDPPSAIRGGTALTLSVHGEDFEDGAVVQWNGDGRPTTFISGQELRAEISAADLETRRPVWITVRNANGGVSNALMFTVYDPPPTLTSLSPGQATIGDPGFTLALTGSDFLHRSVVQWAGQTRTTTYMSETELTAAIAASDIAAAGLYQVTVVTPAPGGGSSSAVDFAVATFTMGVSPASATVTAGQTASYAVQVTPQYGSFDHAVTFSCTGLPRNCTAAFSPGSVTPGADPASATLILRTTAGSQPAAGGISAAAMPVHPDFGLWIIPAIALWFSFRKTSPLRLSRRRLAAVALVGLIVGIACCSAGGDGDHQSNNRTPAGTYQITVQGKVGNLAMSAGISLTVR